MEAISNMFKLDIPYVIMGVFVIIFGIFAIIQIIGKLSVFIGKPVRWKKNLDSDHKLLRQTANKLNDLTDVVHGIAKTLNEMERKNNETELKKLKDGLTRYYNKYRKIGEWTPLEKDAFWDLFQDYEERGGDGYIHTIVEPVMREMRVVDE